MDKLIKLQFSIFEDMKRSMRNYKKDSKDRKTPKYMENKLEVIKEIWKTFNENHRLIVVHDIPEELDAKLKTYLDEEYFCKVEETYIEYKTQIQEDAAKLEQPSPIWDPEKGKTEVKPTGARDLKLPRINLSKFSGDYKDWRAFYDLYVTLIHNNESLSPVEKLHYLKSSLQGEAEQLLKHFTITEANYRAAWNLLKERFDNPRLLIKTQLKILFSQPCANRDTAANIRKLLDTTNECVQALSNLGIKTVEWDTILTYIVSERLPPDTKKLWEQTIGASQNFPKFEDLKKFLESQFRALEALGSSASGTRLSNHKHSFQTLKSYSCVICSASHPLWRCPEFVKMEYREKRNVVIQKHLCSNCLARGHYASQCPSKTTCFKCQHRHHTLLHNDKVIASKTKISFERETTDNQTEEQKAIPSTSQLYVGKVTADGEVLLATALVKLVGENGRNTIVRALVDQGSQASFLRESIAQDLQLRGVPMKINISGLGDTKAGVANSQVTVNLQSIHGEARIQANLLVLRNLNTILPSRTIRKNISWSYLQGLALADPRFYLPAKIDMVIGADILGRILLSGFRRGPPGSPIAQNTTLGWILSGEIGHPSRGPTVSSYHCKLSLDEQLRKFWEIEEVNQGKILTEEEKACEDQFQETVRRAKDGKYIVRLPFRKDLCPKFGRSRCLAVSRLRSMETKFENSEQFRTDYVGCLEEYLKLRHMEPAATSEIENMRVDADNQVSYTTNYLPHHAVVKESTTTKLRVVFDASSKTINGPSLNDVLLTGPTLQDDLMTILLRWRKHQVALTADIEKMYRQIWVDERDAEYQRIVWRKLQQELIKDYRLNTVTFGTTSAPYLAVRVLQQLARDEGKHYPLASSIALSDFYIDDLLTGANTVEEALELQRQLRELLKSGGFNLRKWASNKIEPLTNIPNEDKELSGIHSLDLGESVKTLGLYWYPKIDKLKYTLSVAFNHDTKITKRIFLSDMSKLFDPLGLLSPIMIKMKILMQVLWLRGTEWDEEIPNDILLVWQQICNQLKLIEEIEIPRWIGTTDNSIEIHGFCDGSPQAYAAVLYVRSIKRGEDVNITLLTAKTKVTPIKPISLPRVELCGATLLARLYKKVLKATHFVNVKFYAWTDSTIVLSWLRGHPKRYKTFVANRIAEIQEICSTDIWNYVPTDSNPADCASRGLLPAKALKCTIWWKGPDWLYQSEDSWPSLELVENTNLKDTEIRSIKVNLSTILETNFQRLLHKYSSLMKLIRITAYCFRFISECKSKQSTTSWLTSTELETALKHWIKQTQAQEFSEELKNLQSNAEVTSGQLVSLSPFLDGNGVIRVGGRLHHAQLSWSERHPIILPSRHKLTDLIIDDAHILTLHGGPQIMLATLRRKYWILRARSTVRMRIHKCMVCFRQTAKCGSQLMGSLPAPRSNQSRPFSHVGVDYCGPIEIKSSKLRNAKREKCYIAIFICLAVKAVHIEVVSELSTRAFLAAFRRFTGRRGMCSDIYSDNGTNFVGAKTVLKNDFTRHVRQLSKEIPQLVTANSVNWHFIPPAAPHFGGLWESAVKATKFHLKRVLGNTSLTFEELTTLTVQIEACLNSRPLCPMTNDLSDLTALTPGHFLVGAPLLAIPEPSYLAQNEHSLNRWHYIQRLSQAFWKRWQNEYLSQLQQRPKWKVKTTNFKRGDLVLIKEDKLPPCDWLLARITDTHPGADNLVRVVSLQTKNGTLKRPITKICLLPMDENWKRSAEPHGS